MFKITVVPIYHLLVKLYFFECFVSFKSKTFSIKDRKGESISVNILSPFNIHYLSLSSFEAYQIVYL